MNRIYNCRNRKFGTILLDENLEAAVAQGNGSSSWFSLFSGGLTDAVSSEELCAEVCKRRPLYTARDAVAGSVTTMLLSAAQDRHLIVKYVQSIREPNLSR